MYVHLSHRMAVGLLNMSQPDQAEEAGVINLYQLLTMA